MKLWDVDRLLREEWGHNHGCSPAALYGDDGELLCHECRTDFRRLSLDELWQHVQARRVVQAEIACRLNLVRNAIDADRFEEARALLQDVKQIARPSHPEVFYLEQMLPIRVGVS